MRRTEAWWAALTRDERCELVQMDRAAKEYGGSNWNLPEGYSSCSWCSTPTSGGGLCPLCSNRHEELIDKADRAVTTPCPVS